LIYFEKRIETLSNYSKNDVELRDKYYKSLKKVR